MPPLLFICIACVTVVFIQMAMSPLFTQIAMSSLLFNSACRISQRFVAPRGLGCLAVVVGFFSWIHNRFMDIVSSLPMMADMATVLAVFLLLGNEDRIVYDEKAVAELLDRSQVGQEEREMAMDEYLDSFKVASYQTRENDEAVWL